jgi:hypothetical protein
MPRVVPSQVVELIDQLFPNASAMDQFPLPPGTNAYIDAIVAFAKEIPSELLTVGGQDLADYVVALSIIETTQRQSMASGLHWQLPEYRGMSPLTLLRRVLAKCADEAPSPKTTELLFIVDPDLRESIRRDISAANQDLINGEWKGATVLAGSATEALLLWAIQNAEQTQPGAVKAAVGGLVAAKTFSRTPNSDPERWGLIELIEVALQLALISAATAEQARIGKDFRNLIHPGRAARLGTMCSRATALSALAAVEHVVRDLTP